VQWRDRQHRFEMKTLKAYEKFLREKDVLRTSIKKVLYIHHNTNN
jgi:hypothetical protein